MFSNGEILILFPLLPLSWFFESLGSDHLHFQEVYINSESDGSVFGGFMFAYNEGTRGGWLLLEAAALATITIILFLIQLSFFFSFSFLFFVFWTSLLSHIYYI